MQNIFDLSYDQLAQQLADWGQPRYRPAQIWSALYQQLLPDFDAMTTLPKTLREQLRDNYRFGLQVSAEQHSSDGSTRKLLFTLHDGRQIETVLMQYSSNRRTICISTQAGCALGCVFCATGQMGFMRHLTAGEIVEQVLWFARELKTAGNRLTNVVFMGMGEPFHNYEATMTAVDRLNDPDGLGIGARRLTISTVGLVPQIERFTAEKRQVNLAVSLHAATDAERSALLPVNKRYDIAALLAACRKYVDHTGRRITFEWALIADETDTPEQAHTLAGLLSDLDCHVNVIPLNPTPEYGGKKSSHARVDAFCQILRDSGISCTVRVRRGIDISAGCGQLATEKQATVR